MGAQLTGKRVVFTGASRGMGHYAALELARRGAEILVVGHNEARGAAAVEAIRAVGARADSVRADMGNAEEVRALATNVLARPGSIDLLVQRRRPEIESGELDWSRLPEAAKED